MTGLPPDEQRAGELLPFSSSMVESTPADGRIDFERGMRYLPPATQAMIAACCVAFIWQSVSGGLESEEALVGSGALVQGKLLDGEIWRLVTSMFLHGGLDHLIGNMIALFILGIACEHAFGSLTMLWIYAAAGVVGGIASAAVEPAPTVGASGAIFGLMGCLVAMLIRHRGVVHVRDGRIALVVGIWAAWQLFEGFMSPTVANFAHVGGLVAGMLLGATLPPKLLLREGKFGYPRVP